MTTTEEDVARHYGRAGLEQVIRDGLAELQANDNASPVDLLAGVDEFHMGGRAATIELADTLDLFPGLHVLDIGCGLGGTARFLATEHGCRVTGVDLTPEYVETGNNLTRDLGLASSIELKLGSALDLPVSDAAFDRATLLHVGMNIDDKTRMMAEAARVLKPGGLLGIYDVMRTNDGPLAYPVAWAEDEQTSFVATPTAYAAALDSAGFDVTEETDRGLLALEFFGRIKRRIAQGGPPPLGLHLVMGANARDKLGNMLANLQNGLIAPVRMIARKR